MTEDKVKKVDEDTSDEEDEEDDVKPGPSGLQKSEQIDPLKQSPAAKCFKSPGRIVAQDPVKPEQNASEPLVTPERSLRKRQFDGESSFTDDEESVSPRKAMKPSNEKTKD